MSSGLRIVSGPSLPAEPIVYKALSYATRCLRKSTRTTSDEPAICHAIRVAELTGDLGADAQTIALALVHDVLEDGTGSVSRIRRLFGRSVAEGVVALSKPILGPRAARRRYYHQVLLCSGENVQTVKLADFLDNARSRSGTTRGTRTLRNALDFLGALRARPVSPRMRRTIDRVEALLLEIEPLRAAA